jgi:hypothetical protein
VSRIRPFKLVTPSWLWRIPLQPITLLEVDTIYGVADEHDTPYMTRATIGRLRLHIFWRGDADPDPHDHPWGFWTFPLTSYVEEVIDHERLSCHYHDGCSQGFPVEQCDCARQGLVDAPGRSPHMLRSLPVKRTQTVKAWRLHYRPATHTHRVLGRGKGVVRPGPVVTFVWREEVSRPWGFLKCRDGRWCWQDWHAYVFEGGKHAPCVDPDALQAEAERAKRVTEARLGE